MVSRAAKILAVLILVILTAACGQRVVDHEQVSREEKIVIRFSHVVPENTPKGLAARRFAALVHERTGGRVEVQVFPNSTLYKDGEELQALQDGNVQLIAPVTAKLGKMFPRWQLFDLPYAFNSRKEVHRAVDGEIWDELCKGLEERNMKALAFWDNGFKQLTNDEHQIIYPEDCKGMFFRVMINSDVLKDQFRVLGATPVPVVFSELYQSLDTGDIDGQENTLSNIVAKRLHRVQSYLTVSNHGYLGYVVLTNTEFWDSLPRDIQKILADTMAEVTVWEREKAWELDHAAFNQLVALKKMKVHIQTAREKEEWMERLQPVYKNHTYTVKPGLLRAMEELKSREKRPAL